MSGANPWSVKGIDPKVREAARDAARRQGLTLGEYLNQALAAHESAKHGGGDLQTQTRPSRSTLRPAHAPSYYDDMDVEDEWQLMPTSTPRLADPNVRMQQRLEAIERRTQLAIAGLDRTVTTIDRSLLGLSQRVDDAEAGANDAADKVVEALEHFRNAHEALSTKLKEAENQVIEARRALEGASVNVDDVRVALEERVSAAEKSAKEAEATAIALANRLANTDEALTRKVVEIETHARADIQAALTEARAATEEAARAAAAAATTALTDIRAQQDVLGQRLATTEHAARQAAHNAIAEARAARQELTERIERIEQDARGAYGGGAGVADLQAAQEVLSRRIAEIESGVRGVSDGAFEEMRRIQTALNARLERIEAGGGNSNVGSAAIEEIRSAQSLLANRLEKTEQAARDATAGLRQAAGAAIADLRNAQLGLSARVKTLEETGGANQSGAGVVSEMQARVQELAARIAEAESRGAKDSDALRNETRGFGERIEAVVTDLSGRLNASEAKAAEASGAVGAIEESVKRLTARLEQTEAAANNVIQKLEETVAQASANAQADSGATEALRTLLEKRLDDMAQNTSETIAAVRAEIGEQVGAALGGLRADEIDNSIAEVNRRIASAERRQAQTIEAISIEIKRMSETVDRRLRSVEAVNSEGASTAIREEIERMNRQLEVRFEEIERREAGAFDRMGLEIGRLAERMDERFVSVETRSAQAIEQIGEQVARMAERFNQRQEQTARDLNDRIIVAEDRMQARLADVVANLRQHADEVEAEERFTTPTQSLADYAARLAPMMDTPVRAGPVHTPPTNFTLPAETPPPPPQEDFAFGELASPTKEETSVAFIDDDAEETHEIAPHAIDLGGDFAADEDDAIIAEDTAAETAAQPDPFDVDPFAADLDDVAPPPPEDDDLWEEPKRETVAEAAEPSFDAFLDPEPELSLTPEAEAAPKEDYLAAARRAALAHAAASSKPVKNAKAAKKSSGETPVTGLKGPGRVILWGAAGAMAAALVGGALLLRASPSEETDQANDLGPDVVGPNSAQAAQGAEAVTPDTSLFSDSPVEGAEPPIDGHSDVPLGADATTPEAHLQGTSGAQGEAQATRTVAGPVTTRNQTLQQAVAAGDAVAQYDLALQRLAANQHAEAVGLLRRSAAQGLAMAQYRLAKLYERGEGVPADLAQSRQWTERAAAGGNRRAMHDLGVFYARGEGAPLDEQAAFRWFRQAAELGVTDSQYNLGVLYQQGRGVAANASEAMFWFLVAARGGDGDARTRATALETTLTQTQADQARQRAGAFRPRAASARANGEFGARAWATRQTAQR